MAPWIILGLLVVVVGYAIFMFNKIVVFKNHIREAEGDISVQLQNRAEITDGLLSGFEKGAEGFEKSVLTEVTKLRKGMLEGTIAERVASSDKLDNVLGDYLGKSETFSNINLENYPDLKGVDLMKKVQEDWSRTSDVIMKAKRYYNGYVKDYSIFTQVFPNNLFAKMLGGVPEELITMGEEEKKEMKTVTKEETKSRLNNK